MSKGQRLEKVANVSIVIAVVLFVSMWGLYFYRSSDTPPAGPVVPDYGAGDTLPAEEGLPFAPNRASVLLFVNSECRFCTASMPFYRKLTADESRNYDVFVVSKEPFESLEGYLASNAVAPDRTVALRSDTPLRLRKTPTLIVTDDTRVVRGVWVGQLSDSQQAEVLSALSRPQS